MKFEIVKVERRERKYPTGMNWTRRAFNEYRDNTRLYIWFENETVLDHLVNRCSEPHREYRKSGIVKEILKQVGLDPNMKYRWSRYAGCKMCPCSPGFILEDDFKHDIWVTLTGEQPEPENAKDKEILENRKQQLGMEV